MTNAILSTNCHPDETALVQRRSKEPPHTRNVAIPTPTRTYNQFMGGVDLNDQLRSYYIPLVVQERSGGAMCFSSFLMSLSAMQWFWNAFLHTRIHTPRRRRTLLQYKLDLAKQLIGGYSGRKRYPGQKRTSTPSLDNAMALPNLPGHQQVKFSGRKRVCMAAIAVG